MSRCIRPVIEKWGESMTYLSRDTDIDDLLGQLAEYAGVEYSQNNYSDMMVVWLENGVRFLDWLEATELQAILDRLADGSVCGGADDAEYERVIEDIKDLKAMAATWRGSVDPQDGALRIYCD